MNNISELYTPEQRAYLSLLRQAIKAADDLQAALQAASNEMESMQLKAA